MPAQFQLARVGVHFRRSPRDKVNWKLIRVVGQSMGQPRLRLDDAFLNISLPGFVVPHATLRLLACESQLVRY